MTVASLLLVLAELIIDGGVPFARDGRGRYSILLVSAEINIPHTRVGRDKYSCCTAEARLRHGCCTAEFHLPRVGRVINSATLRGLPVASAL